MTGLYHPTVAAAGWAPDNGSVTLPPQSKPPSGGLGSLIRQGGRWWMWAILVGVGLALAALVVLQALEYLAPFVYVAL